jgi:phytoene dehydrogenase-like protein
MHEPDFDTGHLLRNPARISVPGNAVEDTEVLIIGGGISGLSALRTLRQAGWQNVILLELEAETGGNSVSGSNSASRYPWAAHYLPVPDVRNTELLRFLEEAGVITDYRDGLPVYNEFHLCAAPEERLFMAGRWQDGLVPATGVSAADEAETARFFRLIETYRNAVGADGKDMFRIPRAAGSFDETFMTLDQLSFADWLDREGFGSQSLRWYMDYCCMDDYGLKADAVSAWAGLHYFAARKGKAANAAHGDVLTWPEGNGFLMHALRRESIALIRTRQLAYAVRQLEPGKQIFLVDVYDAAKKRSYRIRTRELILATPDFINRRLLGELLPDVTRAIAHTPWLVGTLTVNALPQSAGQGQPLCWDNVIYGSENVGYVNARQQDPGNGIGPQVITFYKPLLNGEASDARRLAAARDWKSWLTEIVADLSIAHPGIGEQILEADIRIWGHGMAGPRPGFTGFHSSQFYAAPAFELAHTDYSGISIFEEAFYQGLRAAEAILKRL